MTTTHENKDLAGSKQDGAQPMDSEQANPPPDHSEIVKPEQVDTEPMDTEVANSEPVDEQVDTQVESQTAGEHVDSQACNELGDSQVVNEPVSLQAVSEPLSSEAVSEPINSEAVSEPVSSQAVGEPVSSQAVGEPLSSQAVGEPVSSQAVGEPVSSQAVGEPVSSQAVGEPVSSQAVGEPVSSQAVGEPVSSQAYNSPIVTQAYIEPVGSQVKLQEVSEPVESQPISDELAHPRPLGEEDIYHPVSSEYMHSQPVNSEIMHSQLGVELLHSQPVSAEFVYSQPVNSDLVHTQPVSAELVHMPQCNLEPVNLQPVGTELVNSHPHEAELVNGHAVGMELVTTQPLSTELPNAQQATPETQPNKRRKKKSIVWEHFTIENVGAGCRRACCKVCKQSFAYSTGSKVAGTSHLKRHIAKGTCPVILRQQEKNQLSPYMPKSGGTDVTTTDPPKRRYRSSSSPYLIFDQDRCRHEIARMIIMHDYPLHMVEHPGFVSFVQNLQPRFDMVSFNIVQGDCVATFLREKQNLQRFIEGIPGRVCLTLDLWTSSQSTGYVFVTGQFIDDDWKLHRRLLNVVMEPFPESDQALSHSVGTCLSDWGLDRKLASITFNQTLSETALEHLRALLAVKNPMLLNGQLLVRNCLARTLSSLAQDVLAAAQGTMKKIRASVKYVKTSESHEEKFLELKQQLQVPTEKSLSLDNTTKWNTTYDMLLAASELKEVFSCLDTSDPEYRDAPSMEDWRQVENICMYLKLLYDTANMLTSKSPQSSNVFFHEVWKIQLELARAAASDDLFVSGIARPLQDKFHRYWKNSCLILAIAVAMDPRFKMKLVEFSFTKIFGEEAPVYIRVVDDGIHELFHEYMNLPLPLTPAYAEEGNPGNVKSEQQQQGGSLLTSNGLTDFDMYIMETTSQQMKSELDQYLEESLLPRVQDFDVLGWWKLNKLKYPTLSKMARDILTIPLSTVPSESVFDNLGKEMDSYRCSLRPETVEALICAKDWLQQESSKGLKEIVKMEL